MHYIYDLDLLVDKLIDTGELDPFLSDLAAFDLLCSENRHVQDLLGSPQVGDDTKRAMLETIVTPFFGASFSALLVRLLDNGDLAAWEHIARQLKAAVSRRYGACFAEVASAVPLTDRQMRRISTHLARLCGHRIYANNIVSKDLLGGFVVTMEGRRIDLSIRSDLLKMKTAVLGGHHGDR